MSARLQVPFIPVPFTMQTSVALGIGLLVPPRLAVAIMGGYLLEGAVGLPFFAGGGGLAYLVTSPTAGFLWGMLVATGGLAIVRRRVDVRAHVPHAVIAAVCWTVVVFAVGVLWLGWSVGLDAAVDAAVVPFVGSEVLKVALVVAAVAATRSRHADSHRMPGR